MKKILVSVVMLMLFLFASVCAASPFLICDPPLAGDPVVTNYQLTGGSWVPASVPAQADGTIKLDLANAPVGTNTMTVKACGVPDDVWEECSDSVPFTFTRRLAPKLPRTLKLIP